MHEYLSDLLTRMLDESKVSISSKSIGWDAYREAEKLTDVSFIPQLIEFIDQEKDRKKRERAYFILGKVAEKTNDLTATKFLIKRVDIETDKYVLSSLLERITNLQKPQEADIQPLINAINNKNWQVKHSAITALIRTNNPLVEDVMINILRNSTSEYELGNAIGTLSNVGTLKSISYLTPFVYHKKEDVSNSALYAIISISGKDCLPLCLEQLDKGKNKTTALRGVLKFGDEKVIPHLIKRIKELVAKQRARELIFAENRKTEIIVGMEFLQKYSEKVEVKNLFEFLLTKKYDLLWKEEKEWLDKNKLNNNE